MTNFINFEYNPEESVHWVESPIEEIMTHRYICDVIEEARKCFETRNFSYILGLLEEIQTLANRMESNLYASKEMREWDEGKYEKMKKQRKDLEKEINKLVFESIELENKRDKIKEETDSVTSE